MFKLAGVPVGVVLVYAVEEKKGAYHAMAVVNRTSVIFSAFGQIYVHSVGGYIPAVDEYFYRLLHGGLGDAHFARYVYAVDELQLARQQEYDFKVIFA